MKKVILFMMLYILSLLNVNSQSITTSPLAKNEFCIDEKINIEFQTQGTFNPDNIFIAQISDLDGTFYTFQNLSTLKGTSSGTITNTFPINFPLSTKYRVRVISSSPYVAGSENGTNIRIRGYASNSRYGYTGKNYFSINEKINLRSVINYNFDTTQFVCQWNLGDVVNPIYYNYFANPIVSYTTPGIKKVTLYTYSDAYCWSARIDTISFQIYEDCKSIIDSTAFIVDSTEHFLNNKSPKSSSKNNKVWILPNGTYTYDNEGQNKFVSTFYLEVGASLKIRYVSGSILVYMKPGSSFDLSSSYGDYSLTIMKSPGTSLKIRRYGYSYSQDSSIFYGNNKIVTCNDINFTYSEAPKDGIKIMQSLGYLDVEDETNSEMQVYPNPTSNVLKFSEDYENATIQIISIMGNIVYESDFKKEINISNFNVGTYIAKIISNNRVYSHKFEVIK